MKRLLLTILFLVWVSSPAVAAAKTEAANWDNLKQLAPGVEVKIVLNDAKAYPGQFKAVTDEAIVLRLDTGAEQTFTRQDVLRVSTEGKKHRGRNALIGMAIGAGAGVIVGAASPELGQGKCEHGSCVNAASVAVPGLLGALAGAGCRGCHPHRRLA
jgi:hypothetical protein